MKQSEFLALLDKSAIEAAIGRAERACSGEIRVHVQARATGGDLDTVARKTFERLGMTMTKLRNGVLLFIASEESRFAILGDSGIHEKVGDTFWNDIAAELSTAFGEKKFTEGIVRAIDRAGAALAEHFPPQSGDVNELTNEISVE